MEIALGAVVVVGTFAVGDLLGAKALAGDANRRRSGTADLDTALMIILVVAC